MLLHPARIFRWSFVVVSVRRWQQFVERVDDAMRDTEETVETTHLSNRSTTSVAPGVGETS